MRRSPRDLRSFLGLLALVALLANALPGQGGFTPGHIYLHTASLTSLGGGGGLVHIDPYSGSTQVLLNYPTSAYGNGIYDHYRDRILVYASIGGVAKLYSVDASGTAVDAGAPLGQLYATMASRGDGIVYCRIFGSNFLSYLDAANALHTLPDATGVTPYAFPGWAGGIRCMIYHPGENALYAATPSAISPCGGGLAHLNMYKLPLSADGTRVMGPVTCAQATVAPFGEDPNNWSLTPDGNLFLVVDTNSGPAEPKMLLIDPVSLSATPFAWVGPYIGEAATNAGIFSTALGAGVILDTGNDVLRVFPQGSSGSGTILATGVSSAGGSGEVATLFEIQPAGISHTLRANTGTLSLFAGGIQALDFTPGPTHAGGLYLVLGSLSGWTPGIPYGGYVIPLINDWYTDHTIVNANLGPLFNNLGVLSGTGAGQAQLFIPPNTPPAFAGVTLFHAAVEIGPGFALLHVSNPVAVTLVP